jgi:regulator of sirC expression with transglutaminase-like and TPR domain
MRKASTENSKTGPWGEILIDPFDGGRVLTTLECQRILDEVYGGGVRLREHHLRSVSRRQVLSRLLAHLKSLYLARHDLEGALASADRLLILDDRDPYEVRDHGLLAMQTHHYHEAIADFERYLELMPHAEDREAIRERVAYLRAWLVRN